MLLSRSPFAAALVFGVLATATPGFAKAKYLDTETMIAEAPLIGLVDVERVEEASQKGKYWTYAQAARVKLVRGIRGELPKEFTIHARKNFICASVNYQKGRYLVFLRSEGKLFTTFNHGMGSCRVEGKGVRFGFSGSNELPELEKVLERVAEPKGYFPEKIAVEGRRYTREAVEEVSFPGRDQVLGKLRLYTSRYRAPIGKQEGNVRGFYNHNRLLFVDAEGVQRPLQELNFELLRAHVLGIAPKAKTAAERERLVKGFMHVLQGGRETYGEWWGNKSSKDTETSKGRVYETCWTHGKSFSWTDVFRFRFKGGQLEAIDHEVRRH